MVEGLSVKTVKVEEDVRIAREEVHGMEGRLEERIQPMEKNLEEVKILLEKLVSFSVFSLFCECSYTVNDWGESGTSLFSQYICIYIPVICCFTAHTCMQC